MRDIVETAREAYEAVCSARGSVAQYNAKDEFYAAAEGYVEGLLATVDGLRAELERVRGERDAALRGERLLLSDKDYLRDQLDQRIARTEKMVAWHEAFVTAAEEDRRAAIARAEKAEAALAQLDLAPVVTWWDVAAGVWRCARWRHTAEEHAAAIGLLAFSHELRIGMYQWACDDAIARAEQAEAVLARVAEERDEALKPLRSGSVHPLFHRQTVEKLEAERDAAIARAEAAERERDARPAIATEDAAAWRSGRPGYAGAWPALTPCIYDALCDHASKVVKP